MYGIIYKVTNLLNNKLYIGQTIKRLDERKAGHLSAKDESYFHRALAKHGVENFVWEVIDESATTADELNALEQHYIATLKTHSTQHGYNMTWGGDTSWELTREHKIKTVSQFDIDGNYVATFESLTDGATATGLTLDRVSYSATNGHPTFNTRWQFGDSKVYQHKLRARGEQIHQFNADGEYVASYDNALHASEQTGADPTLIRMCITGEGKSAGGYLWSTNADATFDVKVRKAWDKRPILQLDADGEVLAEFKNYSAITSNASYRQMLRNRIKTGKPCKNGFYWRRK